MNKAVFLDRDGIIVKNIDGEAPIRVSGMELIPKIIPILFKLKKMDYRIIVTSNQPNAAQGIITEETKEALVKKFEKLLKKYKFSVDGIYYCFHHPQAVVKKYAKNCDCKKPKPGMLLKAMYDHKIKPNKSFMIGDRASDIKAGSLTGIKTILFDPENLEQNYLLEYNVKPDFTIKKLPEIIEIIKENS